MLGGRDDRAECIGSSKYCGNGVAGLDPFDHWRCGIEIRGTLREAASLGECSGDSTTS